MRKKLKIYQKIILCVSCVIVLVMSFSLQAFAVATDDPERPVNQSWQPIQLNLTQFTIPSSVTSGDSASQLKAEDGFRIYADNPSISVGVDQTYETWYTFYEPTDNGMTLLGNNRVTTTYVSSNNSIINHIRPITGISGYDVNNSFSADVGVNLTNFFVSDDHTAPRIDVGSPLTYVEGLSKYDTWFNVNVVYSGILCYPRKEGGAMNLEFLFTPPEPMKLPYNADGVPSISKFAFSLAPSHLNINGNPTRLSQYEIYKTCYDANPAWQHLLREPDFFLTNDVPCKFSDLQVKYDVDTFSLDVSTGTFTELTSDLAQVQSRDIVISNPYDPEYVITSDFNWNNSVGYIVIGMEETDWFGWLTTGIRDILAIEVFPNFYLWTVLAIPLALSLIFWALKVFAGG